MNVVLRPSPMSAEEFLDWVAHQEERFEFDGIRPVLMNGEAPNHNLIAQNINRALYFRLKGSAWRVFLMGVAIRTIQNRVRFPDVFVTRAPFDGEGRVVADPAVVFEVISKNSDRRDRIKKADEYEEVRSILRYVVVERTKVGLVVFERPDGDQRWTSREIGAGASLGLPELGFDVPVDEFYEDVTLPRADSVSPGRH